MGKESVKVFVKGYEFKFYKEMSAELIYAIESGLLDMYETKKEKKEKPILTVNISKTALPEMKTILPRSNLRILDRNKTFHI